MLISRSLRGQRSAVGRDRCTVLNDRWILKGEALRARRPDLRQPVFILVADEHQRRLVADWIMSAGRHRQHGDSAAVVDPSDREDVLPRC